jgi:hypothetical protein
MKLKFPHVSEQWARTIDSTFKIVTGFAIVIGGYWTLYQYRENRAVQLRTERIQSIRPLLEKRLEYYLKVTSLTATVAKSANKADVAKAKERFLILYHGPLRVLGHPEIRQSLLLIDECIEDSSKCKSPLESLSDRLADDCQVSLLLDWPPGPPTNLQIVTQ